MVRFQALISAFNRHYPTFLEFLVGLGDVIMMTARTTLVSLGLPVLLCLLLYVEHERVKHGISLFETSHNLASLGAWALVLANTTLEFLVHYVEDRAGYRHPAKTAFSLRLWAGNVAYALGLGRGWSARLLSPAHEQRRILRLVTVAILALALTGSMESALAGQAGAWYMGLAAIVTESSLLEFVVWAGGLLFTLAAVRLAQVVTGYIARKCAEISLTIATREEISAHPQDNPGQDEKPQPIPVHIIEPPVTESDTQEAPAYLAQSKPKTGKPETSSAGVFQARLIH